MENSGKYRIVECKNGFYIQMKVVEKKYYGLWPFRKFMMVDRWVSLNDARMPPSIITFPKMYKTIEEAKIAISEIEKYPIYHYL